ncbi:MAG: polysaccharide biosynthesis/export family protein [Pyrinomonadaceae bacterium]
MISKLLRQSAFAIALLCVLGAADARAQRVGPVEDDALSPADGAKPAGEKRGPKPDAKTAEKPSAKTEEKSPAKSESARETGEARRDHASAPVTTSSTAPTPQGEKTASGAAGGATPEATPTPSEMPVHGSPSIGALPPPPAKYEPPAPIKADIPATGSLTQNNPSGGSLSAATAVAPTAVYRVGIGDILDIRLVNGMGKDFTLFTVLANGAIDYPLAGEPVGVLNLTTDEIGTRLSAALKRRGIFDRAQFQINVRDYASHTVLVSGLVEQPGQKVLRREAVPLYVVLAEAFPRADAGRVVIISRATGGTKTLDLSDSNALNELVSNGDVINVQPRPQEFFYIAGSIGAPGQKDFHVGMTLTQAILAAGGVVRGAGNRTVVTVSRQAADGRLVPAEYVLQEIEGGKIPDPRIQPGDRIEVGRRR